MADINDSYRVVINKDGKEVIEKTTSVVNRKGYPIRKIVRTEGEKLARVEEYHSSTGVLKSKFYSANGLKEGFFYEYDQNGHLMKVAQYKNDRLVGLMQEFHHSSDIVKKEIMFDDGAKQGLQIENLRDGIFTLSVYSAGRKTGPKVTNDFYSWEEHIKPFTTTYYLSNKEVSEAEFMAGLEEKKQKLLSTETPNLRQKKAEQLKQLRKTFQNEGVKEFLGNQFFKIRSQSALAIRVMNERAYRSR